MVFLYVWVQKWFLFGTFLLDGWIVLRISVEAHDAQLSVQKAGLMAEKETAPARDSLIFICRNSGRDTLRVEVICEGAAASLDRADWQLDTR